MNGFFTLRWRRFLRLHSRRWTRRATFIGGGIAVGLLAAGLAVASDAAQGAFKQVAERWPYAPLFITPIGFAFAVFLASRFFPNTQGSGIPQAIAARSLTVTEYRPRLVGFRVAVGKVLLTLLGLLIGSSTGREGPTVQVGASVMFLIGRLTPHRQPGLILAGSAAGVAAAFNTPLAGIVFAIEEMSRSFESRASGLIIAAVIIAGFTAQLLLGDYAYFGFVSEQPPLRTIWVAVPVCGIVGGFSGALFSRLLIIVPDALPKRAAAFVKLHPVVFATACGVGVALCGLAADGTTYGTGYAAARAALHNDEPISAAYATLKFLATTLSSLSGIPGGIFSPSLSIGAGIGADIARLINSGSPGTVALLGMVAYFTGVVRAPITGFVIVSEMCGNPRMMMALMATALLADACARLVNHEGVYHALSKRFVLPAGVS